MLRLSHLGLLGLGLLLAACQPASTPAAPSPSPTACSACAIEHGASDPTLPAATALPPAERTESTTAAPSPTTAPMPAPSETPAASPSTTPGTPRTTEGSVRVAPPRLPPEKWREWPVVPALTGRFAEIYAAGLALGNDPQRFSKIGDCQSVNAAFFGIYDRPGQYGLPRGEEHLQETIDWFKGSFDRASEAVRGGFNVASVLSPLFADPKTCKTTETPLDCEFRIQRPSIVLISMETGFEGRTAATYEKYLRRIIEYAIQKGAAPILATKADNFEGDHSINLVTARLAAEYGLPLWNFWRAVQPLPNHGLDPTRPDNFHISVEAWNMRSYTALQALDSLWRAVR